MIRFFVTVDKKAGVFTKHIWQPYLGVDIDHCENHWARARAEKPNNLKTEVKSHNTNCD